MLHTSFVFVILPYFFISKSFSFFSVLPFLLFIYVILAPFLFSQPQCVFFFLFLFLLLPFLFLLFIYFFSCIQPLRFFPSSFLSLVSLRSHNVLSVYALSHWPPSVFLFLCLSCYGVVCIHTIIRFSHPYFPPFSSYVCLCVFFFSPILKIHSISFSLSPYLSIYLFISLSICFSHCIIHKLILTIVFPSSSHFLPLRGQTTPIEMSVKDSKCPESSQSK